MVAYALVLGLYSCLVLIVVFVMILVADYVQVLWLCSCWVSVVDLVVESEVVSMSRCSLFFLSGVGGLSYSLHSLFVPTTSMSSDG